MNRDEVIEVFSTLQLAGEEYSARPDIYGGEGCFDRIVEVSKAGVEIDLTLYYSGGSELEYALMPWEWVENVQGREASIQFARAKVAAEAREAERVARERREKSERVRDLRELARLRAKYGDSPMSEA